MENHISVCVCTYKRPQYLEKLIRNLEKQKTEKRFSFSVVIVDNDHNQSARSSIEHLQDESNIRINYFVEPEQNIARARNKAIENAKGDLIAFIDDDEYPIEHWLLRSYKALHRFRSDGVLGPVIPSFECDPPRWVVRGRFFCRPRYCTGRILEWGDTRTGNALVRKAVFRENGLWFNPVFGSGGEDRDFFRRRMEEGYVFVWCDEAPVFETVSAYRWQKSVFLKRALLRGKVALSRDGPRTSSVFKSVVAAAIYACSLPVLILFETHIFMKCLVKQCDHLGKIAAVFGINLIKERYIIG